MRESAATENAAMEGNQQETQDDNLWIRMARDAYQTSQDYFNSSLRREFEDSQAHFNSRHAPGSKYLHPAYRKKSKFFRPKTRAAIRNNEMAVAVAMFSTQDVVHISAINEADDEQVLAAEIKNQLLNFRMNEPDMCWFMTCIGGAQDAMSMGAVVSRQDWSFKERASPTNKVEQDEEGHMLVTAEGAKEVVEDRPVIDLVPLENIRFHPACDWRDPVKSSPYVIELVPMHVGEVVQKSKTPDKLDPNINEYREIDDIVMRASIERDWDSVRKMREGNRVDKYENLRGERINDFRTVWVHRNIIRIDGYDYVYETLGPETLLSRKVRPIEDVFLLGERPYSYGVAIIEAHKLFPAGIPKLTFQSQEYTNDIANLRQDNLRLTLNKRYWVRRGSQVDILSLKRNVAGGTTLMSDVERDVKESSTPDVTRSSYEEQDRLNADFDEIAGSFSPSSVMQNRGMNETVGGMNLMSSGASMMQEYVVRTVTETWAERALRQIMKLIERYESNVDTLQMVAAKHKVSVKTVLYLLQKPSQLRLNVGFGATNPQKRIEKMMLALGTMAKFFPDEMQRADRREVSKEIFGAVGYRDGARFLPQLFADERDPYITQLEQENQQLRQVIDSDIAKQEVQAKSRETVARINQETQLLKEQFKNDVEGYKQAIEAKFKDINARLAAAKEERERLGLALEREALSHAILQDDREFALKMREMNRGADGAMNLKGEDKAGIISRQDYGLLPDSPR